MAKRIQRKTSFPLFIVFVISMFLTTTVVPQESFSKDPLVVTFNSETLLTTISVDIETQNIEANTEFSVTITVKPSQDIAGIQCDFHYDPSFITVINVTEGNFFTGYNTYFTPGENDPSSGVLAGIAGVITTPGGQVNQTGVFATLYLKTLMHPGLSPLNLSKVIIGGATAESLPVTVYNTQLSIHPATDITTVSISPPAQTVGPNQIHTLSLFVSPVEEIAGVQATLHFDPAVIQILNITQGTLFGSNAYFYTTRIDEVTGIINSISIVTTTPGGTSLPGTLAHLTYKTLQEGTTSLGLTNVLLGDPEGNQVSYICQNGTLTISTIGSTQVTITPSHQILSQETTVTIDIYIDPQEYIAGVQCDLTFDPALLTAQVVTQGNFFQGIDTYFHEGEIDNSQGVIQGIAGTVLGNSDGAINLGIFATITFITHTTTGQSPLGLKNVLLGDSEAQPLSVTIANGSIEVLPNYTLISINPETKFVSPGDTFTLDIWVNPFEAISGAEVDITFDPTLLIANTITEGDLFTGFNTHFNNGTIDNTAGTIQGIWGVIADIGGGSTTTPGSFAQITFTSKMATGSTPINISHALIGTPEATPVHINILPGTVTIGVTRTLTYSLTKGWNALSLPFQEMITAKTLGQTIGVSDAIAYWDPVSQEYIIYPVGLSGQDFTITPGYGYLIHAYENTQFSITGTLIEDLTLPLTMGWNLIGWIHESSTTAEQFGATITGCDAVAKWKPETQDYIIHPQETPLNIFTIRQGDALFIHTTQDSIWYGN